MNPYQLPEFMSQRADLSGTRFATNGHANLLSVAAIAAERKADAFADAGDDRKARLHREIGGTRRRVIEVLQGEARPATRTL